MQPDVQPAAVNQDVAVTLADGSEVLKNGQVRKKQIQVPQPQARFSREIESGRKATHTLEKIHRKLGDLPTSDGKKLNPIAAVVTYSAIGLNDEDIAVTLGATVDQIRILKESEIYKQISELFDRTTFEDARRNAKHIIASAADKAATRIVEAVDSESIAVALSASRDVMRINGIDNDQINEKKPSGLSIRIIRKSDQISEEEINISVES